jgi:hypothetical protein
MNALIELWERRARYIAGGVAALLGIIALLFELGWVSTTTSYQDAAWYSVSEHSGFVVTTRHADETSCKQAARPPGVVCRTGRSFTTTRM